LSLLWRSQLFKVFEISGKKTKSCQKTGYFKALNAETTRVVTSERKNSDGQMEMYIKDNSNKIKEKVMDITGAILKIIISLAITLVVTAF
jgi:hypothetical protein